MPGKCKDADNDSCVRQPVTYGLDGITSTDVPYGTPLGLAKDGHIIVGPYNDKGELWSCEDHDICNGVFLKDNSYAYAMTYTFPYVVGCWGPGPNQIHKAECSQNSCSGDLPSAALSVGALIAGVALALQM